MTRQRNPVVRWRGAGRSTGRQPLNELTVQERMLLFIEGQHGLEPLWLWLNERGMPFGWTHGMACSGRPTSAASTC